MLLTNLSDTELVEKTKSLAGEERRITAEILQCLQEIDMRKLYAEHGCSSLHEFCIKVLLYSEGQAHRRITAARILNQIPGVEEKLRTGELTLTNVAQAQAYFNDEKRQGRPVPIEEKHQILQKLEGLSARKGEQVLAAMAPDRKSVSESLWALDMDRFGFRTELSRELKDKLERIKSLMRDCPTYVEALERMADLTLKAIDPVQKAERAAQRANKAGEELESRAQQATQRAGQCTQQRVEHGRLRPRPAIHSAVRHYVWIRDQGRCTWVHPQTGERCSATRHLELDHLIPYANGGTDDVYNLRLACRAHNVRHGVKSFGIQRMATYSSANYGERSARGSSCIRACGLRYSEEIPAEADMESSPPTPEV